MTSIGSRLRAPARKARMRAVLGQARLSEHGDFLGTSIAVPSPSGIVS